jgi:SPP1 family predicted phage head-tail adaptor
MEKPLNMNRRVSFQVPTTVRTGMGAPQKGFAHSFYAWVSREQLGSGNEQYVNDRLVSPYNFRYHTHYQGSINETMRIVDDSVSYNILSVTPDDMKMFIDIIVEKVTE